jgi:succinoglycan biosynthesis transport protein ExoP
LAQYDVNLREYWRIVRKRKFTVLVIALILGVFSTTFAILRAPTPIYTTVCVVEIKKEAVVEGVYNKTVSWSDSDDIETQMTVIKSYAVFEKVAERLGLIPRSANTENRPQLKNHVVATIESLQGKVEVTREKYSSILNITVTDGSPLFAQRLANAVALVYKELHGEHQTKRTREALRYIDEQLRDVRERLREAEDRFNRFSKENELISIDLQSENLVARAQEIQKEIAKLEEEKSEFESIAARLSKFINNPVGSGHNFDSVKANSRYQSANDALVSLLLKRDTLLKEYTPKHPEVTAINDEIMETARKMDYLLQLHLRGTERREGDLQRELESLDKKTKLMLDKKLEFNRLKREVELYTDMTTLLERKNQEALIKRSEKPEEVNIVKPALLPSSPINPPRTVATGAMGIVIGFIFGLVIAFIVETFDTSLGAIEDVEQTLKTPVLGVIPQVDVKDIQETAQQKHPEGIDEHSMKQVVNLIAHFVPKSMMAESFRALRANIQFKNTEKKIKTLAITSASPQEGKTLVAVNLAITMAQAGMKTLLVGSDLRKPMVAKVFGIESSPGLSDILLGNFRWRETVKNITDLVMGEISLDEIMTTPGLDNLFIITGGPVPPNPAELIESERFNRFIEEAKKEFDMVIFDTAPILSAVDAALIGTKVEGILLLYRVGAVSRGLLKRAMSQLEQVKSQVVGVILNGMRPEVSPDFEDYKHYKYYYSYGEDGKKHKKERKPFFRFKKKNVVPGPTSVSGRTSPERRNLLGSFLLLVGIVILGLGILWHNGIIDPLKLVSAGGMPEKDTVKKERIPITPAEGTSKEENSPGEVSQTEKKKADERVDRPEFSKPLELKTIHSGEELPKNVASIQPETQKRDVAGIGVHEEPVTGQSASLQAETDNIEKPAAGDNTHETNPADMDTKRSDITPGPAANPVAQDEKQAAAVPRLEASPVAKAEKQPDTPPGQEANLATEKDGKDLAAAMTGAELEEPGASRKRATPKAPSQDQSAGIVPKKAPKMTPQKMSKPAFTERAFPYSLYLGSVPYPDQAEKGVARHQRNGIDAYWVEVELSKGIWYRLYTGYFESEEQAEKFKEEKGLKEAEVKELPYANLIASCFSKKEAQAKAKALREQGCSPYVAKDDQGTFRVLVGAFYNEDRAQRQYSELKAKGIESEIVKR